MNKYPIRFGVHTGQQNIEWEELRSFWAKADGWGYDSLWVYDHFYPVFSPDPNGPCLEGWTLLSALSQVAKRARIGAIINSNTYRNPALTAKMAATLDQISGGRLNLELGAGWSELEHQSLGFDFKTLGGRLQLLDEACQIIKGMFSQDKTTIRGKHWSVVDAVCNPKPAQKNLPLLIGGQGERVLLKIVAKYADMWNAGNADDAEMKRLIGVIERHGDAVGRNADEIEMTLMMTMCYGAPKSREESLSAFVATMAQTTSEQARERMIIGSKQECVDKIERYIKAGVSHFIFQHKPVMTSEEDMQAFAEEIMPQFRH
jgi:F420-dependent oxidoreductase-like protein